MICPNSYFLKSEVFHHNVSAGISSANQEVGGHGVEQGASCGEKKPCDGDAVDGKVQEHLDQSHLERNEGQYIKIDIFSLGPCAQLPLSCSS